MRRLNAWSRTESRAKCIKPHLQVTHYARAQSTDLLASRLDQEQRVANSTGHLMCMYSLQSIHLVRICTALLP